MYVHVYVCDSVQVHDTNPQVIIGEEGFLSSCSSINLFTVSQEQLKIEG